MLYNFDYISPELRGAIEPATLQSHRFEKKLGFRLFKSAYVAPYIEWNKSIGCVIDESGTVIKDSECLEWKENDSFYQIERAAHEHKKVIFLGFLLTGFGHSYTDDLRKLWFLDTEECKLMMANGWELVFTTSWNQALPAYVMEIMELAGYDISGARLVDELVGFDEVCIPDNSFVAAPHGRMYCPEYEKAIGRIIKNIPETQDKYKKVYFSRSRFTKGTKKEYGEKKIERVFSKLGYSILFPEDYTIVKQIQMMRNCDSFAATEGSVAHLSLFCLPGTNVTIVNKANYLNFHQVMINEFSNLSVTYVEAHHSIKAKEESPWHGPFYLCINVFLERYYGKPILHLPYWIFPSYWEYSRNILYRCYNRIRKTFG